MCSGIAFLMEVFLRWSVSSGRLGGKHRLNLLFGRCGRVDPAVQMPGFYKVVGWVGAADCVKRIDEDELDLHLVGNQALDVDAGVLTGSDSCLKFRKPGKIWGKFHKDAVRLH